MLSEEVIFLPGTLCDSQVFAEQLDALKQANYRCTPVDFGRADSLPQMAQLTLSAAQQGQFHLIAFSMGGMVAFELFRQAPERIKSVVLIASNAHADLPGKADIRAAHLAQARDTGIETLIAQTYMPNYLYHQQVGHQQAIVEMANVLGIDVFAAQLKVLADRPDSTSTLARISCPTLILGADHDPLCPTAEQRRMHSHIRHSQLEILPDSGHFVMLEQPKLVNEHLLQWLQASAV